MAIKIISTMLSEDKQYVAADNKIHIIHPFIQQLVPVHLRDKMEKEGKKRLGIPFMFVVNVLLWGGTKGEKFSLSGNMKSPNGRETGSIPLFEDPWPEKPFFLSTMKLDGQFSFEESGLYTITIDLNLIPSAKVQFAAYWEDEPPPA
jgi:hypothetical protein